MTTGVRFYDSAVIAPSGGFDYYNNNFTSDGTAGKGRFVLTVDPFTAPSGTDGQFDEFDFVVDDPGDSTMVIWGALGVNVAASPTVVTGGFTFDSNTPTIFDYWFVTRRTKADYDTWVAGDLVVGATNYARNNATFYDGAYQIQGLGFVVPVDAASVTNWWTDASLPPSTPPTITAPTTGTVYTPSDDLALTITWTEPGTETDSQVVLSGAYTFDSGSLGAATSAALTIPYGVSGTITVSVRAKQTASDWSAYSTVTVTVTPNVDTPVSCIEAEMLLDTPRRLWIPRHTTGWYVDDLSGNGDYLHMADSAAAHSFAGLQSAGTGLVNQTSFTVTFPSGPATARKILLVVWGRHLSGGSPNLVAPAGWTVVDQRYVADGGTEQSWHVLTQDHTGAGSYTDVFNFDTNELHDYSWFTSTYLSVESAPIAIGSASVAAGTADLVLADLDGSANPADTGIARVFTGGYQAPSTTPSGWTNVGTETTNNATTFSKRPWSERDGSGVTVHRATTTGVWFGLNLLLRSSIDELIEETSGVCDPGCTDVNYALGAANGTPASATALHHGEANLVSTLTAWTLVLIAGLTPDDSVGVDSDYTELNFSDTGSTLKIAAGHLEMLVAGPSNTVSSTITGRGPARAGCGTMVAITYDHAAADKVRFFGGDALLGSFTTDPGVFAAATDPTFLANIATAAKGKWSVAAVFGQALTRRRLQAYASHVCTCPGGQGFVLGHLTFN